MDDEAVGGLSDEEVGMGGRRRIPPPNWDEMDEEVVGGVYYPETQPHQFDEMDEDECSTRNFDRVLVATVEMTGRAPNPACARAVFDKICDQCEDNIQCYLKLGRQVGPETRQCQPRRLRGPMKFKSCTRFGGCKEHIRL